MTGFAELGVAFAALLSWRLWTPRSGRGPLPPTRAAAQPLRTVQPRRAVQRRRAVQPRRAMRPLATRRPGAPGSDPARWAGRRDVRDLRVPGSCRGRLTLGRAHRGLVAAERGQSVLVVGPTQSGKTRGLAIPALLEWDGPVVAASVKTDLARHTIAWRRRSGPLWVYDPTGSTELPVSAWSPLAASTTWAQARRTAASLTDVARASAPTLSDGDFWYATAAKLLAPLLLAAATTRRTMADVVRWVDTWEIDEVHDALAATGEDAALQAAQASWARDDRQRSAVYTTAETVIEAFADPAVADHEARWCDPLASVVDAERLLDGAGTLYLCAPARDQRRLRPLFATMVGQVVDAAYERVARHGAALDPPLLVVLDEAANVAPLAELDGLASTAAGHGVQLVTVWQDLAQVHARYGQRAGSVVNNHRVKVFLSGIADTATLEHLSALIGDGETRALATTRDWSGATSLTDSPVLRRLAPADALRRVPPGRAVVVSGHLPPVRVELRPWSDDPALRARATGVERLGQRWSRRRGVDTVGP